MEKKQYNTPAVEVLGDAFEDIIVASGGANTPANEPIALKTDVFDK